MLTKLRLQNFKPFRSFAVDFTDFNLLVGKNNMGKSTLVDALRLISLEANYRLHREIIRIPEELFGEDVWGFMVEPERIPFPTANVHYEYEETPSHVAASFRNNVEINLAFTASRQTECFLAVRQGGAFLESLEPIRRRLKEISIAVLPPVAPFEEHEELLTRKYVNEWFGTHRSPRHFRNLWYWDSSDFEGFQRMLRDTWPGVDVLQPELAEDLRMYFTEDRITREVAWAGHGMQVWMQILTYLAKMHDFSTLVLDEPEIFLHSDIQRKLVDLLRQRASQTIVATHSVDIINEAPPSSIVLVDKWERTGKHLESIEHVQRVVESLGSVQNVQLLSLIRSRFALFVEGDDRRFLRALAEKAGFHGIFDSASLSVLPLEGEGNWRRLRDLTWIWRNIVGEPIRSFVLLDRDYETDASVESLTRTLRGAGVGVHVWKRKELENYFLVPNVIRTAIIAEARRRGGNQPSLELAEVENRLLEITDTYRDYVSGQLLGRLWAERRATREDAAATATSFLRDFQAKWESPDFRIARVPGKDVLSDLSRWSQATFRVSLSADRLIRNMQPQEVDPEITGTLARIVDRAQST